LGSIGELEYDLLLAKDLRLVPARVHAIRAEQVAEARRMLSGCARALGEMSG
jgi:hypothetical protein